MAWPLQVGRQRFKDDREWLYDEDLDAVRVFWQPAGPELQLSVSRQGLYRTDVLDAAITGQTNNYLPGQAFPQADGSVFASVKLEWKW